MVFSICLEYINNKIIIIFSLAIKELSQSYILFLWEVVLIPYNVLSDCADALVVLNNIILLRVLQRKRMNIMFITTEKAFILRNWLVWLSRLSSQNLQGDLVGWRPRRADAADEICRPSFGELLPSCSEGWSVLFYPDLQLMGQGPPTLCKIIYLNFTDFMLALSENTLPVDTWK